MFSKKVKKIFPYIVVTVLVIILGLNYSKYIDLFFTHDDFFHLKISRAYSFGEFFEFFNIFSAPEGFGFYRPLTTQSFYFISWRFFDLNPIPLRLISWVVFGLLLWVIYKFLELFTQNKYLSLMVVFLYGASATHFIHLTFLGAFQEIGMALFYILSCYGFLKHLKNRKYIWLWVSIISFVASLMSKETAVTLPAVLFAIYLMNSGVVLKGILEKIKLLVAFVGIDLIYLYLHYVYYGIARGDSYIWDFSPRVANTLFWYTLWGIGVPEMFVDFIGPSLKVNSNLFIFYGEYAYPIVVFSLICIMILLATFVLNYKILIRNWFLLFGLIWFLVTLLPFVFLPWHKFSFLLTVPLVGLLITMVIILERSRVASLVFIISYLLLSTFTINLTDKTHWVIQGSRASGKIYEKLSSDDSLKSREVVFIDVEEDKDLPWKPSGVVKEILSDKNFSDVFLGGVNIKYGNNEIQKGDLLLISRDFLNY